MGAAGRTAMEPRSVRSSYEHFWEIHERAFADHLRSQGIPAPKGRAGRGPVNGAQAPIILGEDLLTSRSGMRSDPDPIG